MNTNTANPVHPGHVVSQHCRDCDYAPGSGSGSHVALRAMRSLYSELAIEHASANEGHRVVTCVDGTEKAIHVFHGTLPVAKLSCDQCHTTFPKPLAVRWEDLVLCPACG